MSSADAGGWIATLGGLGLQAVLMWYAVKRRPVTVRQAFLINASYAPVWAGLLSFTSGEGWGVFFAAMGGFLAFVATIILLGAESARSQGATRLGYMTLRKSPIAPEWDQVIYPPNPVPRIGRKWKRMLGAGLLLAILLVMLMQTLKC